MDEELYNIKVKMDHLGIIPRPKILLDKIKKIELDEGICLPKDYVLFITQIGDGWERQIINRQIWKPMDSFEAVLDTHYIGKAFPYQEKWIWENADTNPLPGESDDEWNERVDKLMLPKHFGNIPLIKGGSGETFHLIVNGPECGKVWVFTNVGIVPCLPVIEFLPWLNAWLSGKRDFL